MHVPVQDAEKDVLFVDAASQSFAEVNMTMFRTLPSFFDVCQALPARIPNTESLPFYPSVLKLVVCAHPGRHVLSIMKNRGMLSCHVVL